MSRIEDRTDVAGASGWPTSRDEDVQLDARRRIVRRGDGESESGAVADAGRDGHCGLRDDAARCPRRRKRRQARSTTRRGRRSRQVQRTGTASGTTRPRALRAATAECASDASASRSSARKARRIRSTAGATDGKSMTTSSAKQQRFVAMVVFGQPSDVVAPADVETGVPAIGLLVP